MWHRAAHRIDSRVAHDQVQVGSVLAKWVIARRADLIAALPPAMLPNHDPRVQTLVEPGLRPYRSMRRLDPHPVALSHSPGGAGRRMQFDFRIARKLAQAGDAAVLRFAEMRVVRASEDQWIVFRKIGS